jgi:hypothetical protein
VLIRPQEVSRWGILYAQARAYGPPADTPSRAKALDTQLISHFRYIVGPVEQPVARRRIRPADARAVQTDQARALGSCLRGEEIHFQARAARTVAVENGESIALSYRGDADSSSITQPDGEIVCERVGIRHINASTP